MRAVALKDFESRVSEYVQQVKRGETVLVTQDDRVIAELVPPRPGEEPGTGQPLANAVRRGWVTPAASAAGIPPRKPVVPLDDLLRELDEDRGER